VGCNQRPPPFSPVNSTSYRKILEFESEKKEKKERKGKEEGERKMNTEKEISYRNQNDNQNLITIFFFCKGGYPFESQQVWMSFRAFATWSTSF
jgi:hypothetical protein